MLRLQEYSGIVAFVLLTFASCKRIKQEEKNKANLQGIDQIISPGVGDKEEKEEARLTKKEEQEELVREFASRIRKCSSEFNLDETRDSQLDRMVQNRQIGKGLENDNLYFMEGTKIELESPEHYLDVKDFQKEEADMT